MNRLDHIKTCILLYSEGMLMKKKINFLLFLVLISCFLITKYLGMGEENEFYRNYTVINYFLLQLILIFFSFNIASILGEKLLHNKVKKGIFKAVRLLFIVYIIYLFYGLLLEMGVIKNTFDLYSHLVGYTYKSRSIITVAIGLLFGFLEGGFDHK